MRTGARVAVVTTSYPRSEGDPSGHFVRAEVRALERSGHEVEVFAPKGEAFGWPGVLPRLRAHPLRATSAVFDVLAMQRSLRRGGPWARVIAHWLPTALIARGVDAPLTVVAHGSDVRLVAARPPIIRERAVELFTSHAQVVRVVSESLGEALLACAGRAHRGSLEARMVVEAAPIEIPARSAAAAAVTAWKTAAIGAGSGRLGVAVGRLIAEKRVDRVLTHVAREGDWRLVVVGEGPERERLETRARDLGVDASFVGLVAREEALAWIANADTLFHASEAEGLSTVIREAEALGTRVVRLGATEAGASRTSR